MRVVKAYIGEVVMGSSSHNTETEMVVLGQTGITDR